MYSAMKSPIGYYEIMAEREIKYGDSKGTTKRRERDKFRSSSIPWYVIKRGRISKEQQQQPERASWRVCVFVRGCQIEIPSILKRTFDGATSTRACSSLSAAGNKIEINTTVYKEKSSSGGGLPYFDINKYVIRCISGREWISCKSVTAVDSQSAGELSSVTRLRIRTKRCKSTKPWYLI